MLLARWHRFPEFPLQPVKPTASEESPLYSASSHPAPLHIASRLWQPKISTILISIWKQRNPICPTHITDQYLGHKNHSGLVSSPPHFLMATESVGRFPWMILTAFLPQYRVWGTQAVSLSLKLFVVASVVVVKSNYLMSCCVTSATWFEAVGSVRALKTISRFVTFTVFLASPSLKVFFLL